MFRAQRCDRQRQVCAKWRDFCDICKRRLPSGFWKLRHQQIHEKELEIAGRKYHCTNCHKRFKEIANYIRHCGFHSVLVRSQPTKDIICNKLHEDDGAHVKDLEEAQSIVSKSKDQSQLKSIPSLAPVAKLNGEHNNGKKGRYECEFCGRVYMTKLYFDMHVRKHKGVEHFKCDLCPKIYTEVHKLNVHQRISHKAGFLCSFCGQRFPTKDRLIEHRDAERLSMRTCDVCGKVFTTVRSLHIHQRIHSGERPFKCSLCGAAFTQQYHLLDHERTHSGATPFACNYCDLSFTTQSSRRRHEKNIHKIGLPTQLHVCDVCKASFVRKDVFARHLKQHERISSKWAKLQQNVEAAANLRKINHKRDKDSTSSEEPHSKYSKIAVVNGKEERNKAERSEKCLNNGESNTEEGDTECSSKLSYPSSSFQDIKPSNEPNDNKSLSEKEKCVCSLCVKQFSSHSSLSRHFKNIHKYGGNGAICEICNACYIGRKTLQRHMLHAHNVKTVQEAFQSITCEECGALVQTANGLDIHKVKCH